MHDHVTRRSISGLIVFVGSTPVIWTRKRQGCIATRTYCADFISMQSAVEVAISISYMLRSPRICSVIQKVSKSPTANSKSDIAARIVTAHRCRSDENLADICTKALGKNITSGSKDPSIVEERPDGIIMESGLERMWHRA